MGASGEILFCGWAREWAAPLLDISQVWAMGTTRAGENALVAGEEDVGSVESDALEKMV